MIYMYSSDSSNDMKEVRNVAGVLEVGERRKWEGFLLLIISTAPHHQAKMAPSFIIFVMKCIRNGLI